MGYAARAGFGLFLTAGEVLAKARAAQTTTVPIAPKTTAPPTVSVPSSPTSSLPTTIQPLSPAVQPILVAGPAPSSSGGGGSSGVDVGLAPATGGGINVSALLQQPAVLVGLAILGFLALRRGGGTRRF